MTLRDAFMSGYMEAREQVLSETLHLLTDSTQQLILQVIEAAAVESADKYFPATEGEINNDGEAQCQTNVSSLCSRRTMLSES
jgi:hypothetical protein